MTNPAPAKMTITAYSDPNFTQQVATTPNPFTVWINPASYSFNSQIMYSDRQAQGSTGSSPEYNRVGDQDISFELVFDATGVVPPPTGQSTQNGVADAISQFTNLTATVNGSIHSPNYLVLGWAQLQFTCVLTSMKVDYTLFRPDGTPLRAKVSVSFKSYVSETMLAKTAGKESPDMTHLVTFKAGDTLPLLCHQIYGASYYYTEVARFNGLLSFRQIAPGTLLLFPPLGAAS